MSSGRWNVRQYGREGVVNAVPLCRHEAERCASAMAREEYGACRSRFGRATHVRVNPDRIDITVGDHGPLWTSILIEPA